MLRIPKIKRKTKGSSSGKTSDSHKRKMRGASLIVERLVAAMRKRHSTNNAQSPTRYVGGDGTTIILNNPVINGSGMTSAMSSNRADSDAGKAAPKKTSEKGVDLGIVEKMKGISLVPEDDDMQATGIENTRISYPLIPLSPRRNEKVYAYAIIEWDPKENAIIYKVIEPPISVLDRKIIEDTKKELEERLDVNFAKIGEVKAKNILRAETRSILSNIKKLNAQKMEILEYYIERDVVGYGKIEPLMRDPSIEDISCDGFGVPIYVYHRNPKLNSLRTNIKFTDKDELDMFVMKLAQKCGRSISVSEPLVNGGLPDGSRIQATLGTDIAMKGSNFTIRKFTSMPLTPVHMLEKGTLNSLMLAYLWLAIEYRKSILISGGTATGKTSLLNALSLFIKPSLKVVSIEDTPELRLSHPHWVPEVARTPISVGEGKIGEVSLFDLLKESLRQRPDYIIVGEVRGKEAYVLFQQIATGHAGLATIHAASFPQLIDRLVTPPISLSATLVENIDIIIFLTQAKIEDKYLRRVKEIIEITGVENERPVPNSVFEWKAEGDGFISMNKSKIMNDIKAITGMKEKEILNEIGRRKIFLEWLHDKKIYDYKQFSDMVTQYYINPEKILAAVDNDM
ncbi:MAG: type II/IV secretion system ATPase subunit [Candidatus Micrarchaeota archaeon]|nr:type II/IV secretion system ATPase subunit [Candidatus Micrarchaeota archaeon]